MNTKNQAPEKSGAESPKEDFVAVTQKVFGIMTTELHATVYSKDMLKSALGKWWWRKFGPIQKSDAERWNFYFAEVRKRLRPMFKAVSANEQPEESFVPPRIMSQEELAAAREKEKLTNEEYARIAREHLPRLEALIREPAQNTPTLEQPETAEASLKERAGELREIILNKEPLLDAPYRKDRSEAYDPRQD